MSMNIKQCKMCGRIFPYISKQICYECEKKLDEYFLKVRDYLYTNPVADVVELSKNTGVEEKYILDFLREERLTLNKEGSTLYCDCCGRPIKGGKYCDVCKTDLHKAFTDAVDVAKKQTASDSEKDYCISNKASSRQGGFKQSGFKGKTHL